MLYLTFKNRRRPRRDGREWVQAFVVRKTQKFGRVLSEQSLSTRRPVLITGAHHAGKSYWLERLRTNAEKVWPKRAATVPLHLAASRPLSAWTDVHHLAVWWAARCGEDGREWMKLKAWERADALPLYLQESGAVLFVDDAHQLSGRKLKVAQECIRAAPVWVAAAADEGRLAPGLRTDVLEAEPQIFRLDSEVAYDATPILMWLLIAVAITMGSWELAMALGGLKMLGSGRRAARQA